MPVTSVLRKIFLKESLLHSFTFGFLLLLCFQDQRLEIIKCHKKSCSSSIFCPDLTKETLDISQESLFRSYCCWLGVIDTGAEPSNTSQQINHTMNVAISALTDCPGATGKLSDVSVIHSHP